MTVRELIAELLRLDPDKYILVRYGDYAYELDFEGDTIPLKNVHDGIVDSERKDATQCYLLETWT